MTDPLPRSSSAALPGRSDGPSASADLPRGGPGAAEYFPGIDGLRGIAVLAVLLFHLRPARLPGGFAGVDLFFVISGFVVTGSLARHTFTRLPELLAHFYARRMIRILPALLAMVLATSLLATYLLRLHGVAIARAGVLPSLLGVGNIHLALYTTGYFTQEADFTPFLHTWTLGVEEQFYLVFPFLLHRRVWAAPGQGARALRIVVVVSLLSFALCGLLALTPGYERFAFYLMPSRLWELGAGVALWLTMPRWRPLLARPGAASSALGVVCLAGLGACFLVAPGSWFPFPAALLPVGAGMGLIALVCARPGSLLARGLAHPVPVSVGRISYSLYLWHWPVFVLFRWTVGLEGRASASGAVALSFLLAAGSYMLLEQPLRRSAAVKPLPRRTVLAMGAGSVAATGMVSVLLFAAQPRLASATASPAYWGYDTPEIRCAIRDRTERFHDGTKLTVTPGCPRRGPRRHLFVAGDSHALMYHRMLTRYAADTGTPVTIYYKAGCEFLGLSRPVPERSGCTRYDREVIRELARSLRRGDLLFMPSLRVPRFRNYWTGSPLSPPAAAPAERAAAYRDAAEVLTTLSPTGAELVFGAPLPVFRAQPYRCSDWFNRSNPACGGSYETDRGELLALRAPAVGAMERLAREVPNVAVWDAFPDLCPGDPCSAHRDGKPLFVDQDHLSGHGNDAVYPGFSRMAGGPGR
jgi:peptidoglycan/LPS O-acetylase OafA/YrhL